MILLATKKEYLSIVEKIIYKNSLSIVKKFKIKHIYFIFCETKKIIDKICSFQQGKNGYFFYEKKIYKKKYYSSFDERSKELLDFESYFGLSMKYNSIWLYKSFPAGGDIYFFYNDNYAFISFDPLLLTRVFSYVEKPQLDVLTTVSAMRFGASSQKRSFFANMHRAEPGVEYNLKFERNFKLTKNVKQILCWDKPIKQRDTIHKDMEAINTFDRAIKNSIINFKHSIKSKNLISLSGGLDSSLVASLMRTVYPKDKLYGVSANSLSSSYKKISSDLSEAEAVALIIKTLDLQKSIVSLKLTNDDIIKYASNCVDGIGSAFEYYIFMNSIKRNGYLHDNLKYIVTGFSADGIFSDIRDKKRIDQELQGHPSALRKKYLRTLLQKNKYLRKIAETIFPNFINNGRLYEVHPMIETIAFNEALFNYWDSDAIIEINKEYYEPTQINLPNNKNLDALNYFLTADFTKIGMGTKQRFDSVTRKYGIKPWSPFWNKSVMEKSMSMDIKFRNREQEKFLIREMVRNKLGNEIANRKKYGFSESLTTNYIINKNIIEEVISGSVFKNMPWKSRFSKYRLESIFKNKKSGGFPKWIWNFYWMQKTQDKWAAIKSLKL